MHYLGLDCHQATHSWTLLDGNGQVVDRGVVANRARSLVKLRSELPAELSIGLEGSRDLRCEVERQFAAKACFEISPAWTHAIGQRSPLPDKDDLTDADRAALALYTYADRLVPLRLGDDRLEALRTLVSIYQTTVRRLVATKQRTQRYLGLLWGDLHKQLFPNGIRRTAHHFFRAYPHPHSARNSRGLAPRLRRWSQGRMGEATVSRIKRLTAGAHSPTMAEEIWMAELREALADRDQLAQKQAALKDQMVALLHDMGCEWVLTQPALGPVRAAVLVAGGLLNSPGPNSFARHCGIAPESHSTGATKRHRNARRRHEGLFKVMMGWAAGALAPRLRSPQSIEYYRRKVAEGKTSKTALRCLARRLIDRLFRLRREHGPTDPQQAPKPEDDTTGEQDAADDRAAHHKLSTPPPKPHDTDTNGGRRHSRQDNTPTESQAGT